MVLDTSLLNTKQYKDISRVKGSNPGNGVVPSPTLRCSSYRKGNLLVALDYGCQLYLLLFRISLNKTNELWQALLSWYWYCNWVQVSMCKLSPVLIIDSVFPFLFASGFVNCTTNKLGTVYKESSIITEFTPSLIWKFQYVDFRVSRYQYENIAKDSKSPNQKWVQWWLRRYGSWEISLWSFF